MLWDKENTKGTTTVFALLSLALSQHTTNSLSSKFVKHRQRERTTRCILVLSPASVLSNLWTEAYKRHSSFTQLRAISPQRWYTS